MAIIEGNRLDIPGKELIELTYASARKYRHRADEIRRRTDAPEAKPTFSDTLGGSPLSGMSGLATSSWGVPTVSAEETARKRYVAETIDHVVKQIDDHANALEFAARHYNADDTYRLTFDEFYRLTLDPAVTVLS